MTLFPSYASEPSVTEKLLYSQVVSIDLEGERKPTLSDLVADSLDSSLACYCQS